MRIAFVISTFPPHLGGMGEVAAEEAARLSKAGHEVTVFTLKYFGVNYRADKNFPFKIKRLRPLFKYGDAGLLPGLFFELKNFDLIHLHHPFYGGAHQVLLAQKFYHKKFVLTCHMQAKSLGVKRKLQRLYDYFFEKPIFDGASKILAVSKSALPDWFLKNPKKEIFYLQNAVNTDIFSPWPEEIKNYQIKPEQIILFVGNMLPVKRADLLLQVIGELSGVRLLMVGGGYEMEKYQKMAKDLGVEDKVIFEGECLDKKEMANYYNLADLTVVSSDYESFSLVALEAMACACPVLLSSGVEIKNEVHSAGAGLIFEKGDKENLLLKIQEFLSFSPEVRKQIGECGIDLVNEKYSFEKHMEKLESIYKDL